MQKTNPASRQRLPICERFAIQTENPENFHFSPEVIKRRVLSIAGALKEMVAIMCLQTSRNITFTFPHRTSKVDPLTGCAERLKLDKRLDCTSSLQPIIQRCHLHRGVLDEYVGAVARLVRLIKVVE